MKISLDNKSPAVAVLLVSLLSVSVVGIIGAYVAYWWYVVQYVFNLAIAPVAMIPTINYWQAAGVSLFLGMFRPHWSGNDAESKAKSYAVAATPFITHFLTWLILG
jgi:hypothetical protein